MNPQNIIIDTDLGDDVDDILAIAFALLRPELAVRAITTVTFGTEKRSQIVAQLLQVMGRTDVPFAPGLNLPIESLSPERLAHITDLEGGYILNHHPFVKRPETLPHPQEDAITLMARTVEAHPEKVGIVAIGPLSNIAVFLRRYPELAPKLQFIAIMGGELELDRREHNLSWDATAAEIVFTAGVPLFVGTWNVTRRFVLTAEDCARIKNLGTPLGDALSECIELWWPHKGGKASPVMYDIAPIVWSFDRRFYPTEAMPVKVESRDENTSGTTVRGGAGPLVDVSIDILAQEVRQMWLDTICGENHKI